MPEIISKRRDAALGSYALSFSSKAPFSRRPRCPTSLLDNLPMELVTEIFRYVVKSSPNARSVCRTAFILSTVNRSWRSCALSDPKLWSPICFVPPCRSLGRSSALEQNAVCFQRAGQLGIDVRIMEAVDGDQNNEFREDEVIRIVAEVSSKLDCIRHLRIQLKNPHIIRTFLHALQVATAGRCMKQLQTLDLRCTKKILSSFGSRGFVAPIRLLEATPSLRVFEIDGVNFDWAISFPPLPFSSTTLSSLTVIRLAGLSIHQWPTVINFRQLLQPVIQTLRRLVLDGAGPAYVLSHLREAATAYSSSIPLSGLVSLELSGFTSEYVAYVFDLLDCPNLRSLTIRSFDIHDCESVVLATTGKALRMEKLALHSRSSRSPRSSMPEPRVLDDASLALSTRQLLVAWFNSIPRLRLLVVDHIGVVAFQTLLKAEVVVLSG